MTAVTTVPEDFRHLLQAAFAVLATNGPDGLPQVTAVSFLHDPGRRLAQAFPQ